MYDSNYSAATVAIKTISLDQLKSQHLESLVYEEIKVLQKMSHPNVLKFHEALLSQRNCYIVTELCNQGSLADSLKNNKQWLVSHLDCIIADVYAGLCYLRDMNVVHRDLKPANIFMHNGRAVIADFGLAKIYA